MTENLRPPSAFKKGYALCSPANILQPDSFGETEAEAIASKFTKKKKREKAWAKAQSKGWTVKLVYVRMFVPVFYATASAKELETEE
jgi:hypothetical protein